jgi:hypothetical protein
LAGSGAFRCPAIFDYPDFGLAKTMNMIQSLISKNNFLVSRVICGFHLPLSLARTDSSIYLHVSHRPLFFLNFGDFRVFLIF